MIEITFYKDSEKKVGFLIKNHGKDIVCSAVSILSLNTVNCIEKFTQAKYNIDYDTDGGFLKCIINKHNICSKVDLLLDSLELGLNGILLEYPKEICINYKEVQWWLRLICSFLLIKRE